MGDSPGHLTEVPTPQDPEPSRLSVEQVGAGVLVLTGELDQMQCANLRAACDRAADAELGLTVDLCGVDYLDSAGVSALVEQVTRPLRLRVRTGSAVATVLAICRMGDLAEVEHID